MTVTQNQRIVDLALAGHPPADIALTLGLAETTVLTALQDLTTTPSGQGGASSGPSTVTGDLTVTGKFAANGATAQALSAAYTKTYSTAARTIPVATVAPVVTTGSTSTTPFGYTQAQADAIPVAVNALAADVLALKKLIVALVVDLEAVGICG